MLEPCKAALEGGGLKKCFCPRSLRSGNVAARRLARPRHGEAQVESTSHGSSTRSSLSKTRVCHRTLKAIHTGRLSRCPFFTP